MHNTRDIFFRLRAARKIRGTKIAAPRRIFRSRVPRANELWLDDKRRRQQKLFYTRNLNTRTTSFGVCARETLFSFVCLLGAEGANEKN